MGRAWQYSFVIPAQSASIKEFIGTIIFFRLHIAVKSQWEAHGCDINKCKLPPEALTKKESIHSFPKVKGPPDTR